MPCNDNNQFLFCEKYPKRVLPRPWYCPISSRNFLLFNKHKLKGSNTESKPHKGGQCDNRPLVQPSFFFFFDNYYLAKGVRSLWSIPLIWSESDSNPPCLRANSIAKHHFNSITTWVMVSLSFFFFFNKIEFLL